MFRGRYQLGEELPLAVLCVDAGGTPSAPAEAPTADLWSGSGLVKTVAVPALDRKAVTGLFGTRLFLGADFAPGPYEAVYRYRVGSFSAVVTDSFEVVAGGDAAGNVVSMYGFRLPFATFLVHQLDSGKVRKGKNPRV